MHPPRRHSQIIKNDRTKTARRRSSIKKINERIFHPIRKSIASPKSNNPRRKSVFKLMGAAASVAVLHTPCVQEDCDAIRALFPDRFQALEKYETEENDDISEKEQGSKDDGRAQDAKDTNQGEEKEKEAPIALIEENMTLLLLPTDGAAANKTVSTLTLESSWLRQASERAALYGIDLVKNHDATVLRFFLPGGACVVAATQDAWKDQRTRKQIVKLASRNQTRREEKQTQLKETSNPEPSEDADADADADVSMRSTSFTRPPKDKARRQAMVKSNRVFPSLRARVATSSKLDYTPFPLNAQHPVPIETDLFVGNLIVLMRPEDPSTDPYWNDRLFSKKKRRLVFQLQGKLKYQPTGTVMAGIEISDPMKLGLVTSGLCNFLLKFVKQFNGNLHYSFGDDVQRPHIIFPCSTFMERLVVTPPGEEPPPMGVGLCEFDEPPESFNARKSYKKKVEWNTRDTYSMSFHTMYADFARWAVVELPLKKDLKLEQFWGKSMASIVLYEHQGKLDRPHRMDENKYIAAFQMQNLGFGNTTDDGFAWGDESSIVSESTEFEEEMLNVEESENNDDASVIFYETVQSDSAIAEEQSLDATNITAATPHFDILRIIDRFCPAWIEVWEDHSKKRKYTTVYALQLGKDHDMFLRTWEQSSKYLGDRQMKSLDDRFSLRMSESEHRRRVLGLRLSEARSGTASPTQLHKFVTSRNHHDQSFLQRQSPASIKRTGSIQSCFIARALSDRHWIEEYAVLDARDIQFFHPEKSKPNHVISLSSIVSVRCMPSEECPFLPRYYFLEIKTFGRTIYLMYRSSHDRDIWAETLKNMEKKSRPSFQSLYGQDRTVVLMNVDNPTEEFMHKSSCWNCDKRRIVNCGRFSLRTLPADIPPNSLRLAENALRSAVALQPDKSFDANRLRTFLDHAAALKDADAWSLTESERKAFFLNIYHCMILHGCLVMGMPDSSLKWLSHFNRIAYQCSDDIFSLTELEHNIIRSQMAFPSQFLSRLIVPKSEYGFALTHADIRLNFALNSGSTSVPTNKVLCYDPQRLDKQLDAVTRQFLNATVQITQRSHISITMPKTCQWFASDFGDGSTSDLIKALKPFLSKEKQKQLEKHWKAQDSRYDLHSYNIKYLPFNFDGRYLKLEEGEESS